MKLMAAPPLERSDLSGGVVNQVGSANGKSLADLSQIAFVVFVATFVGLGVVRVALDSWWG